MHYQPNSNIDIALWMLCRQNCILLYYLISIYHQTNSNIDIVEDDSSTYNKRVPQHHRVPWSREDSYEALYF